MPFKLAPFSDGPNPHDWDTLDELIGVADISTDPDASFIPQSEVVPTNAGGGYARGYASAVWHLAVVTNEQRAILREICPGVSADVYIETATNEIDLYGEVVFIACQAIMHWPPGDEDQEAGKTLGLDITFTHLIEVS